MCVCARDYVYPMVRFNAMEFSRLKKKWPLRSKEVEAADLFVASCEDKKQILLYLRPSTLLHSRSPSATRLSRQKNVDNSFSLFFFLFLFLHRRRHQQQRHSLFREAFNLRLICWLIYLWVLLCERNCVCVWEWMSLCVTVSLCQWVSLWRRHCVSVSQCHWVWPVFIHKKKTQTTDTYSYAFTCK